MKTEIVPANIFNPTKVCELRLASAFPHARADGRVKRIMSSLMASTPSVLRSSTHPFLFRPLPALSREHSLKKSPPESSRWEGGEEGGGGEGEGESEDRIQK